MPDSGSMSHEEAEALLLRAIDSYGIRPRSLSYEPLRRKWHGDLIYRVEIDGTPAVARFVAESRHFDLIPVIPMTDSLLESQLRVGDHFVRHGLPFMARWRAPGNGFWTEVAGKDVLYRFLLFDWAKGQTADEVDDQMAFSVGQMLRRFHEAVADLSPYRNLPRKFAVSIHAQFVRRIEEAVSRAALTSSARDAVQEHLSRAMLYIEQTSTSEVTSHLIAVHGDFNPSNVFWDDPCRNILTIIDFDNVGIARRIEELAWVIKWYSRRQVETDVYDPTLARELLRGYGEATELTGHDWGQLGPLIWLSGCMNYHFMARAVDAIEKQEPTAVEDLMDEYKRRGRSLLALAPRQQP